MRTLFKLIFVIIILVVIGLIALPFFVNPNDYKKQISEQVESITGRQLALEGDISLSVFPWIALELGPLSLSNAKGFKAEHFATVEAVEIRVKLMPLLSKQLEMDTVILEGLVLNLEKNKAGKTNWDDLASSDSNGEVTKESNNTSAKTTVSTNSTPALTAINIAGIKLSNANILWHDATNAEQYQLQNLNIETAALLPGKPTATAINFNLISNKPKTTVEVDLAADVMVDLEAQIYALTDLKFTTKATGSNELPFDSASFSLSGEFNADMAKQLVTLNDAAITVEASKEEQSIDLILSAEISSNLTNQKSNVKSLELSADISDPALPGGKADLELSSDVSIDIKQQTATISKLILSTQDLLLEGEVNASKLLSDNPKFAGNINLKPFNLRQLANNLAIELPLMTDDRTLNLVEIMTTFTGSTNHFDAKQLAVTLDQTNLKGQFSVTDFANPAFKFKLALDQIDADRYLPPSTEEAKQRATPTPASTNSPTSNANKAEALPLEALRQINAQGTFNIGKLKISDMRSENIHLGIKANKGLIKLNPLNVNLYQGTYKGNINLDAQGETLKLSINENLAGVQAGPLLTDLNGDNSLSGTANAHIKLSGNGATIAQIKQSLRGNGNFSFKNGAVKGINIAESIRKAKAALKGETITSASPLQTDFASLTGSFIATKGLISNQDLLVMSPLLRINGAGTINLPQEGIDYALKVSIVDTSKGQNGADLAELKGLTIPVKIAGSFSAPKPSVDLVSLFKEKAEQEVKDKLSEKLQDEVGGDLGGLLEGLLGKNPEPTKKQTITPTEEVVPKAVPEKPTQSLEDQAKDALKDKLKSFF